MYVIDKQLIVGFELRFWRKILNISSIPFCLLTFNLYAILNFFAPSCFDNETWRCCVNFIFFVLKKMCRIKVVTTSTSTNNTC
jgi:hypothetical protein